MPISWTQALLVGAGGAIGAVLRWLVSALMGRWSLAAAFPLGTLAVNVSGCLAFGLLAGLADSRQLLSPEVRLFLLVGVLGGFTTFSTLGYETFAMLRDVDLPHALLNIGLHLGLGLAAVAIGYGVAHARL